MFENSYIEHYFKCLTQLLQCIFVSKLRQKADKIPNSKGYCLQIVKKAVVINSIYNAPPFKNRLNNYFHSNKALVILLK